VGHLLELFHNQLCVMLDRFEPAALVFEAPILVHKSKWSQRNDRLEDVARTLAMCGHVEWLCRSRGIEYSSVDLRAVKKELAGFGGADKDDMVAAAEKIRLRLPASPKRAREDASDAFGAWLLLLRAKDRSLSARFDSALWGSRGALF
jgi:Holliday junction resolvasome RuvABC endonuclease subunit